MNLNLESLWLDFSNANMHKDAPPIQRREMERAFKSGVWCGLMALEVSANTKPEDSAIKEVEKVKLDFELFIRTLKTQGREGKQ